MADEIDFENGRISNFKRHVTLSLFLDRATWHTVAHHSSPLYLYIYQISFESEKLFVDGRTDGRTFGHMYGQIEAGFIRSTPQKERNRRKKQ